MGQPLMLLFVANIFLLLFAPWIAELIEGGELDESTRKVRIHVMRGLNLLVLVILGITLLTGQTQIINNFIVKLLLAIVIVYVSVVLAQIVSRLIRMRYGRRIQSQGAARIADTYASRALGISAGVFIGIVALISIVRLFGFDDLLETGGVIGFIGVFLALTQGAWAPDIISGLVILNTRMLVERDVIKLSDGNEEIFARVHRTRAFHIRSTICPSSQLPKDCAKACLLNLAMMYQRSESERCLTGCLSLPVKSQSLTLNISISQKYDCRTQVIMLWNGLSTITLRIWIQL